MKKCNTHKKLIKMHKNYSKLQTKKNSMLLLICTITNVILMWKNTFMVMAQNWLAFLNFID